MPAVENGLVVVDDLIRPRELYKLIRLLIRGNQVLLAAHLHPAWFALLRIELVDSTVADGCEP